MLFFIKGNLKGSEIITAIYKTIKEAKNEYDILKVFNINKGKRYDAKNAYIKIIYAVSKHNSYNHDGDFREERYQILIGIGSYGNNSFLKQVIKIQETICFLRQLLQSSSHMILDNGFDLTKCITIEDCYPSYQSNGDVINEGIMNLRFEINEELFREYTEFEEVKYDHGNVEFIFQDDGEKE